MQRARNFGTDTPRAAGDQHHPVAERKIVIDDCHARQRYLKICGSAQ
jgi:hypothetical protein